MRWVGRVAHLGRGVAQQGTAQLRRVHHSSEESSLSRGCSEALRTQRSSDRVQPSSEGRSVAQKGAALLRGCSVAHNGRGVAQIGCCVAHLNAAQLSRVPRSSGGCIAAQLGAMLSEGKHFVSGISRSLYFWGSSEAAMGGAQRPLGVAISPKRLVRAAHGRARAAKTHQFQHMKIRNFPIFLIL